MIDYYAIDTIKKSIIYRPTPVVNTVVQYVVFIVIISIVELILYITALLQYG